ncbi:MAG: methionyl-tRNA formyltransferase [Deltaproteobacteria bacterium]|nr:methionyl-tRNA formyltransferase [Deltaproteobacteria bacterium]MBW2069686.1 methionyl-tRNA formyltransferase [Deltaproteobacteria bacterium]
MTKKLPSVVFLGTPEFAVPSLETLLQGGVRVLLVITQPDRPRGRGRKLQVPPIKEVAARHDLPVFQPASIKVPDAQQRVRAAAADCLVVVAYGQILPAALLRAAPLGAVNLHASLLPRYRGPAPIQWALLQGDRVTGVTTMLLDEGMDTGDLLLSREVKIEPEDNAGTLHDRLAGVGAALLLETLEGLGAGTLQARAQDHARATYAPMLTKEDARINWQEEAEKISRKIRALDPRPGAFTYWNERRLKLFDSTPVKEMGRQAPGTVLAVDRRGLLVAAGKGAVRLKSLQLEGRRRMPIQEFISGYALREGTVLGD